MTRFGVFVLGMMVALTDRNCVVAADPPQEMVNTCLLKIDGTMEMTIQGKKQRLESDTQIQYAWTRQGNERLLRLDSLLVKVKMDGTTAIDTFMSRNRFIDRSGGAAKELSFDDAPPALRSILKDTFNITLCKRTVDENGKEVDRQVIGGPGAKATIESGSIVNALLFHPSFMPNQLEWQDDCEMSMGNGGYAKGKLTYTKIPGGKEGQAVKVAGTLTNKEFKPPNKPLTIQNARYVVDGIQSFDSVRRDWVSGRLRMDVTYDMLVEPNVNGSANGKMVISLGRPPKNPAE